MRKLLSILLLGLFGLPLAAPLLALGQTPESRLPACCRRSGDHHCAGNMAQPMAMAAAEAGGQASPNPRFAPPPPRCPYTPSILLTQHLNPAFAATPVHVDARADARTFSFKEGPATQCTSDDPALPKRGPPTSNS